MCQSNESGLRCGVVCSHSTTRLCCDRRQVDDAAPPPLSHPADNGLGHKKNRLEIHGEHLVPLGFGDVFEFSRMRDSCVIDENVDGSQLGLGLCDHTLHI